MSTFSQQQQQQQQQQQPSGVASGGGVQQARQPPRRVAISSTRRPSHTSVSSVPSNASPTTPLPPHSEETSSTSENDHYQQQQQQQQLRYQPRTPPTALMPSSATGQVLPSVLPPLAPASLSATTKYASLTPTAATGGTGGSSGGIEGMLLVSGSVDASAAMVTATDSVSVIERRLTVPSSTMADIARDVYEGFRDGLNSAETAAGMPMMLPTYISHLPTGDEAGDALGVEIDAQRIRIGLVRLVPNQNTAGGSTSTSASASTTATATTATATMTATGGSSMGPNMNRRGSLDRALNNLQQDGSNYIIIPRNPSGGSAAAGGGSGSGGRAAWRAESYPLPEDVATSNVSRLLDFVAHCLVDALDRFHLWNKPRIPLAVILCFALEQTSLSRARIIGISKTFDVEGVMGNDIGDLLRSALSAKGLLSIDVVAILNDTAATVLAHAYPVPQTQIGVILSNGINLAYMDKLGAEKTLVAGFGAGAGTKLQQQQQDEATLRPMIINTEVGGYSPFHRIVPTEADLAIESDTGFDGRQRLEKCVGGIYLGELVRYTLIDLAEQNDVFGGTIPETLTRKHAIPLETVFAIEKDDTNNKEATRMLVSEVLGPVFMTASDVRTIWRVCRAVVERAVRLLASAIYAAVLRVNEINIASTTVSPATSPPLGNIPASRSHSISAPPSALGTPSLMPYRSAMPSLPPPPPPSSSSASTVTKAVDYLQSPPALSQSLAAVGDAPNERTASSIVVAVDGVIATTSPQILRRLLRAIREIAVPELGSRICFEQAQGGSAFGAAVLAVLCSNS